jgi:isopentenyl diphosphate isomerase/L-lactate dehydrogenase-like FMN-dependent dehydrogenase
MPRPDPFPWAPSAASGPIKDPNEALDIFDFEVVAHENVPPAHFGFMASGAGGESSLRNNRSDFGKFALRPRRLRNVSKADTGIELFGARWASPIFVCPTASNRAFHPDGEVAVSKAAEIGKHLQMLSTAATLSIEDAIKARNGTPVWFQLYAWSNFDFAKSLIGRAERAGSPVLVITVDTVAPNVKETAERLRRMDARNCQDCHDSAAGGGGIDGKPNLSEVPQPLLKNVITHYSAAMDWDFVRRLRDSTKMKVVIKGILAPEDAALCAKYGMDGVLVSNHGGRVEDTGASTIGVLSEVVDAVQRKIPVLVDSGFRRGVDIVKALAMGATAVGVGRPYLWGLGAFGQAGVEKVLEILRGETLAAMQQAGAANVHDLVPAMVHKT